MDSEVAKTLAELESKLQQLERVLGAAGGAAEARLVDERLEQATPAPPPQAYNEGGAAHAVPPPSSAPAAPANSSDESIELAELARFHERLEQAMSDLLADYERVIRLRGASAQQPPLDQS